MKCPKCNGYMKPISYGGVEVNRCVKCFGLWFDDYELDEIRKLKGSEVIDIGDTEVGSRQDFVRDIKCPQCGLPMLHRTDTRQTHIHFEECPDGHGVYFDSGEFKDLKHLSVGEFFKSLFGGKD